MDDKELKNSGKILGQAGTLERPTNWRTKPAKVGKQDGEQVVDFGKAPWQIVETQATLWINNSNLKTACILDANGMTIKEIPLTDANGRKELKLPPDALYVVLK